MQNNNIELEVLVKGRPITEYRHRGETFIEGREGSEFEILIRNRNAFRIEAVVSVDGLSVLDGKDAGPASSGYLVEANGSLAIPGWTLDNASVAKFQFSGKDGSYAAAATGSARNAGVIGLLAYREAPAIRPHYDIPSYYSKGGFRGIVDNSRGYSLNDVRIGSSVLRESDSNFWREGSVTRGIVPQNSLMLGATSTQHDVFTASTSANVADVNNLGTGFGAAKDFATTQVSFQRGDLQTMLVMKYDNARGLRARGIDLRAVRKVISQEPDAFPGMHKGCQPPPGWRG
jgi:hypothetical protein